MSRQSVIMSYEITDNGGGKSIYVFIKTRSKNQDYENMIDLN